MVRVLDLHEAKSQLSALVEEAAAGNEIIIAKAGVPRARLVAVRRKLRRPGGSAGKVRIAADFDEALPDEVIASLGAKSRRR